MTPATSHRLGRHLFPRRHPRHFADSPPLTTGIVGLAVLLTALALWPTGFAQSPVTEFNLFVLLVALTMGAVDLAAHRTWRQPQAGIVQPLRLIPGRVLSRTLLHKLVGALGVVALALILYRSADIYRAPWYGTFLDQFYRALPWLVPLSLVYVAALHCISVKASDHLESFGRVLLTLGREGDRAQAADFALIWLVKLFFLPLMYGYAVDDWLFFFQQPFPDGSFRSVYEYLYRFAFFVDVVFAIIGYALSLRLTGAHVRWPERTFRGWAVCLMCYMPFWQVIGRDFLAYDDSIVWGLLLEQHPLAYALWGSTILALLAVYGGSTVCFGMRFSNLTYRGTIWQGPYALVRHPAYICKNASMWMVQLPFLAAAPGEAMANTLALAGIGLLYFLRARHEETCCSEARDYRLYVRFMDRHGLRPRMIRAVRGWRPAPAFTSALGPRGTDAG